MFKVSQNDGAPVKRIEEMSHVYFDIGSAVHWFGGALVRRYIGSAEHL